MQQFCDVDCAEFSILFYKIIQIVRALWLAKTILHERM